MPGNCYTTSPDCLVINYSCMQSGGWAGAGPADMAVTLQFLQTWPSRTSDPAVTLQNSQIWPSFIVHTLPGDLTATRPGSHVAVPSYLAVP
jgi:hypothetical protein